MTSAPIPHNEAERLERLRQCTLLDTDPEPEFDDITYLATLICQIPKAAICLVDADRIWFKSKIGVNINESPRDRSFCSHAIIAGDALFVVPDALADPRFASHPLVVGDPHFRFYAGVPIVSSDGYALGTLCIIDFVPRQLTPMQADALLRLGRQVMTRIELRRSLLEQERVQAQRREAEEALQQSHRMLEVRVQERTMELQSMNAILQEEIAERERAEQHLLHQQGLLRSVIDTDPNFIFVKDQEGRFLLANRAVAAAYGTTPEGLEGKTDADFNPVAEEVDQFLRVEQELLRSGKDHIAYEETITDAQGHIRWLHTVKCPIRLPGSEQRQILGICTDVTERKRAEQTLKETEQRLRFVINNLPGTVFALSPDGRITLSDGKGLEAQGLKPGQLVGTSIFELFAGDPLLTDWAERALNGDPSAMTSEGGSEYAGRYHQTLCTPLLDEEGRLIELVGVSFDITERKRSEEELEKIRKAINNASDAISMRDMNEHVWFTNRAFHEMFGFTAEELNQRGDLACIYKTPEHRRTILQALEPSGAWSGEIEMRDRDGNVFPTLMRVDTVKDENGRTVGTMISCSDIRERKRLEAQVLQNEKLASLGELVAGVAHEINNPLATVSMNAQLLEMHPDEKIKKRGETIRRMTERASRIVRSLLTFARNSAGERSMGCLNSIVDATLEMCAYKLRKAEVEVELALQPDLPSATFNDNQIQQVLLNLINNAEHALRSVVDQEKRLVVTTAAFQAPDGAAWVRLSVADNGCGIPPEIRNRIFDPFFTTKDVGEGTGLGLSICHGIVEAHGGALTVESEINMGTTFTIALPIAESMKRAA